MDIQVKVHIRYNPTGEIRVLDEHLPEDEYYDFGRDIRTNEPSCFIWEEGNWACDCNRVLFFCNWSAEEIERFESEVEPDCGSNLFSVRITSPDESKVWYDEFEDQSTTP